MHNNVDPENWQKLKDLNRFVSNALKNVLPFRFHEMQKNENETQPKVNVNTNTSQTISWIQSRANLSLFIVFDSL